MVLRKKILKVSDGDSFLMVEDGVQDRLLIFAERQKLLSKMNIQNLQ